MSDVLRALAFAYRRRGADAMERAKLLHMLSFDLRWLSPDPAKRVIARAVQAGLLVEEGETLRAAFDPALVDIPVNFRPADGFENEDADLGAWPPRALDADVEREIAHRGGLVSRDVAALIVARRRGDDVRARAAALAAPPTKP